MFKEDKFMGRRVLTSSMIEDDGITAFFTTRDLPLKAGERDDLIEEIESNKKLVCEGLNIPLENLFIPTQTHSENVEVVELGKLDYPETDALVTNQKNAAIALNFADCVPVIFYDSVKKVAAIAHAGWRGTALAIVKRTVEKMSKDFSSNPKDIVALIGPCIGKCCFQVKEDVKEKLLETINESERQFVCDKMCVDLKLVNKFQLLDSGVVKIDVSEDCTSCKSELFFSYRKEKGNTARHSAVIMMTDEQ